MYTTINGEDLSSLVGKYGDDLFSANIRDYLGKRTSGRNINHQISQTAVDRPENFWVFNNGVTLLSRKIDIGTDSITCHGLAVINRAQTLGALQEASKKASIEKVRLSVRIVESSEESLVQDIIRFNNTQNPIKAWELRVLDPVQDRIKRDFQATFSLPYQFRRGIERRGAQDILSERLGPWLNSFYGDPLTSHRNSPHLWDDDKTYRSLFNDVTDVRHLLFVYRLGEAVGSVKDEYRVASDGGTATETESTLYSYFRYGAFFHVALHLCAETLAEAVGGGVSVKRLFALDGVLSGSHRQGIDALKKVVKFSLAPLPGYLSGRDAFEHFRSMDTIGTLASQVRTTVNQMRGVRADIVEELTAGIVQL